MRRPARAVRSAATSRRTTPAATCRLRPWPSRPNSCRRARPAHAPFRPRASSLGPQDGSDRRRDHRVGRVPRGRGRGQRIRQVQGPGQRLRDLRRGGSRGSVRHRWKLPGRRDGALRTPSRLVEVEQDLARKKLTPENVSTARRRAVRGSNYRDDLHAVGRIPEAAHACADRTGAVAGGGARVIGVVRRRQAGQIGGCSVEGYIVMLSAAKHLYSDNTRFLVPFGMTCTGMTCTRRTRR